MKAHNNVRAREDDEFVKMIADGLTNTGNFKFDADGKMFLENSFPKAVEERLLLFQNEMMTDEYFSFYLALKCLVETEDEEVAALKECLEFFGSDSEKLLNHPKEYLDWLEEPLLEWLRQKEVAAALLYGVYQGKASDTEK